MFIRNKYTRWYDQIIQNAKSQSRTRLSKDHPDHVYYERHHIIPKSMGGSDDKINLVLLTPKEHFICHLLLVKMCPDPTHAQKMRFALKMIMGSKMTIASSTLYAKIREEISISLGDLHRGKPKTKGQTQKMVATRRSKNNYLHSDVTKNKIREKSKGRLQTEDTKRKRSESMKGHSHESRLWINNGSTQQRVNATELAAAIAKGWSRGRLHSPTHGKTPIHKIDSQGKKIIKYVSNVSNYLAEGWMVGRGPHSEAHCQNISKVRIGKLKTLSHRLNLSSASKKAWSEGRHRPL